VLDAQELELNGNNIVEALILLKAVLCVYAVDHLKN